MKAALVAVGILATVAVFAASCGGGSSNDASAQNSGTAASAPTAVTFVEPTASAQSPDALCAIIIDINTRNGAMKDKQFLSEAQIKPGADNLVRDEMVSRSAELLTAATADVKGALAAQLDYYARSQKNAYAPLGALTSERLQQIKTFEATKCGITLAS
ncbi:MAG: hypothetical protein HYX53_00400 [Chloroflexi bacterium]|nr:hypothetical protein [Chloroflexota bacterium]